MGQIAQCKTWTRESRDEEIDKHLAAAKEEASKSYAEKILTENLKKQRGGGAGDLYGGDEINDSSLRRQSNCDAPLSDAIPVVFYVLYACQLAVPDPEKYLDEHISKFQAMNIKWGITGAILRSRPQQPDVVIQYFEGAETPAKQLWYNIKNDKIVRNFTLLGRGYIMEREFGSWTMLRSAEVERTIQVLQKSGYDWISPIQLTKWDKKALDKKARGAKDYNKSRKKSKRTKGQDPQEVD